MKTLLCSMIIGAGSLLAAEAALPPCPLTEQQARNVLESLDLTRPELKPIADAMAKPDLPAAKAEFAKYFRAKAAKGLDKIKAPRWYNFKRAERTAAGHVKEVGIPYQFKDGVFNWRFNPTKAKGKSFDPEWTWQLNRMSFWNELGWAYQETKDEKFARAFTSQLRMWAKCWPRPKDAGLGTDSGWRTIECGIRLGGNWTVCYTCFANSPNFTDDDVLLYFHCSLEQMRHLMKFCRTGNWLTMEMNGVYTFASNHPEFKESAPARKFAVARLYDDLKKQFLPDGAQYELSTGYHQVAVGSSVSLYEKAKAKGLEKELPAEFREILARGFAYLPKLMTPDRNVPHVNDAWDMKLPGTYQHSARSFRNDPLVDWVASGADPAAKNAPDFTSCFLPWAGYVIFRQNWRTDANYLLFDVGPLGKGHDHQDKLNLILYGYGEELLFDDGGGMYERSRTRQYACSAWDHSVIQVDGQGQNRPRSMQNLVASKPADANFETSSDFDYAEGIYDDCFGKEKNVVHKRQVFYIKPDLFLVCDRLLPKDDREHRYQARWQVDTVKMQEVLPKSGILRSVRNKKADLIVAPLFADDLKVRWSSVEMKPEIRGIYVGRNPRPFRPAATVTHEKTGAGEQIFLTLLYPVRKNSSDGIVKVTRTGAYSVSVKLKDGMVLNIDIPRSVDYRPVWKFTPAQGK